MKHPRKLTIRKRRETAAELIARQEQELAEFIDDNPTDAAMWPDPIEQFAREEFGIPAEQSSEV